MGELLFSDEQDFFPSNDELYDSFDAMRLSENLLRDIYAYGFEKPSAIQQRGERAQCSPFLDLRFQGFLKPSAMLQREGARCSKKLLDDAIHQARSKTAGGNVSEKILGQLGNGVVQYKPMSISKTRIQKTMKKPVKSKAQRIQIQQPRHC